MANRISRILKFLMKKSDFTKEFDAAFSQIEDQLDPLTNPIGFTGINTRFLPDGATKYVKNLGYFQYDATSTLTVDNFDVFATDTGTGRWIKSLSSNSSPSAANIAALAAISDSGLSNRISYYVSTLKDNFYLDKTSVVTANGITVVNSLSSLSGTSPGRWIRKLDYSTDWTIQTTWYIDPSSGNDENTGLSSGTAIKTFAELTRRLGIYAVIHIPIIIYVLGNLPANDPLFWRPTIGPSGGLIIEGTLTQVSTGTFTAVTARNRATNTCVMVEDTAHAASWAADVSRLLKITASVSPASVGASSVIAKDLGTYQARVAAPRTVAFVGPSPTITEVVPQVGDSYALYDRTQIAVTDITISMTSGVILSTPTNAVVIKNFHFINGTQSHQLVLNAGATALSIIDCRNSRQINVSGVNLINQAFDGSSGVSVVRGQANQFGNYWVTINGGVSILRSVNVGGTRLQGGFFVQGPAPGSTLFAGFGMVGRIEDAGVMDWSGAALRISHGASVETGQYNIPGYLWGSSATASTFGVHIESGKFFVNSPAAITVAGTLTATQDFRVASRVTLPAVDYAVNPPVLTTVRNCTWTNLALSVAAGGFGGSAIDPASGSGIAAELN